MPQDLDTAKPNPRSDVLDWYCTAFEQPLCFCHPLGDQPLSRRYACRPDEMAQEGPGAHEHALCHAFYRPVTLKIRTHLLQHVRESVEMVRLHGALNELCLATATMGRHHQAPGDAVGSLNAEVTAHKMQH